MEAFETHVIFKKKPLPDYQQHFELARKCMDGDRRAQFELYNLYSRAMFNICLRMMGRREEAEDVLQNAFVDIFRKIDSFRFESSLGAWIKRIVINSCINELKRRKIEWVEIQENLGADLVSESPTQTEHESDKIRIRRIKEAMNQLPDGYRVVFNLYLMEGYDHREISQILGISEGASKSQYSRAKKKINMILQDQSKAG